MRTPHWEHFSHKADIGIRGFAYSKEASFEQAGLALTAVITDPKIVAPLQSIEIECSAPNDELLFADWINALVYEMATRRMLFSQFKVNLNQFQLRATAFGEPINPNKHHPCVEIKGATFTELKVSQTTEGIWYVQCVVDV